MYIYTSTSMYKKYKRLYRVSILSIQLFPARFKFIEGPWKISKQIMEKYIPYFIFI